MKNNQVIIYVGLLVVGLLLGWVLFGGESNQEATHNHDATVATNQLWTCSMHPQIMQPEAGDCPICGMDLIPAESSAEGLSAHQFKLSENAMALANIQTSIVGENNSDVETGVVLSGKITENKDKTATMPAHFNGRVEKLFVNSLGEQVQKGQAIAQIYAPELIAAQQELITAYKLRASQPKLYTAVKNKFKNWMIHGAQLEEIEQTGNVKNSFTIYSHVSGVVTEIAINVGAHIMDGKPIFKVANLNTVWANFDVYENQISQFKKGHDIVVTTNAYPNKVFKGQVDFIDPILDTQTRTVNLRVVLNNKEGLFKPGMFVEGKIKNTDAASKEAIVLIPASAVLWTGKRSVVYVKPNPKESIFEMQEITLGNQINNSYQVLEGLKNGDEIVTNGTFTVDAAAQLQGKKSMMNKEGGKVMTSHEGHLGMGNIAEESKKSFHSNERVTVSSDFQNQLKAVFNEYIKLKDALVHEDAQKGITSAKALLQKLSKVDMKLLKENEIHTDWMTVEKEIKKAATSILNTPNVKEQRNHFKQLSTHLTNAIEIFGIHENVYLQFCPMADQNKGAYWLSKEEKVINPYYGEAMLTCGEIKQVIR